MSRNINTTYEKFTKINSFRDNFISEKEKVLEELGLDKNTDVPIIETENVEKSYLVKDRCNSFSVIYDDLPDDFEVPSFFNRKNLKMGINDLLTNRLSEKFNLPDDKNVMLHIVVDYSYSMNVNDKLDIVIAALQYFYRHIAGFLLKTKIRLYGFSDECRPLDFPINGNELKRGETNFAAYMKKVLHFKLAGVHNKIILFTDGQPTDRAEAMKMARLIKKNKIDYTQVVFDFDDDIKYENTGPVSEKNVKDGYVVGGSAERRELNSEHLQNLKDRICGSFTEIAEHCGGNQIILRVNELAKIVSVECYDRYLGLLTIATKEETERIMNESWRDAWSNVKK